MIDKLMIEVMRKHFVKVRADIENDARTRAAEMKAEYERRLK